MAASTFPDELPVLAASLYQFMVASEPVSRGRRFEEKMQRLREHAGELAQRFEALGEYAAEARHRMAALARETSQNLAHMAAELETMRPHPPTLQKLWADLGQNYEALRTQARALRLPNRGRLALGKLKPPSISRNVLHMSNGLASVLLYELVLTRSQALWVCISVLLLFVANEITRRRWPRYNQILINKLFGHIARPHEVQKTPAAMWYVVGLLIGSYLFPKHAIVMGALVLGLADPAASVVGKAWGRVKLFGQKSYAGTGAFFGMATLAGWAFLGFVAPEAGLLVNLSRAAGVAVVGALAELFSDRIDDNLTIPLASGAAASLFF